MQKVRSFIKEALTVGKEVTINSEKLPYEWLKTSPKDWLSSVQKLSGKKGKVIKIYNNQADVEFEEGVLGVPLEIISESKINKKIKEDGDETMPEVIDMVPETETGVNPFEMPQPTQEETKFIIYQGEPRAVISDLGDMVEILLDPVTGETLAINKTEIEGVYESAKKTVAKKKVKEAIVVKETVRVVTESGKFFLDSGDKFIVLTEEEAEAETKDSEEDEKEDKKEEDAKPDKNGKYPFEKGYIKEEDGTSMETPDDEKKDPSVAPMAEEESGTEDEKSDADKAEDKAEKKEESYKGKKKVYEVKEEVSVKSEGKKVILEKGDKFIVLSEGEDPEELQFELAGVDSPFKEEEEKTDDEKEKEAETKVEEDKAMDAKMAKLRAKKESEDDTSDADADDEKKVEEEDEGSDADKKEDEKEDSEEKVEEESDDEKDDEKEDKEEMKESTTSLKLKEDAYISGKLYKKGQILKIVKEEKDLYDVEGEKDNKNMQKTGFESSEEAEDYAKKEGWKNIRVSVR